MSSLSFCRNSILPITSEPITGYVTTCAHKKLKAHNNCIAADTMLKEYMNFVPFSAELALADSTRAQATQTKLKLTLKFIIM